MIAAIQLSRFCVAVRMLHLILLSLMESAVTFSAGTFPLGTASASAPSEIIMPRSRVRSLAFVLSFASAGACDSPALSEPVTLEPTRLLQPANTRDADLQVDFAAPVTGVKSMSGFLHGISPTSPPDSLVLPLKPSFWRIGYFDSYERVIAMGARVTLVLSDVWGYPTVGNTGRPWPHQDTAAWQGFVRQMARDHKGKALLWEVWNEPDIPFFWGGTREQFYQTYLQAYRILREELGSSAMIGGPSFSNYSEEVHAFVDFCRQSGCEVNFLSWHELGLDISGITERLANARNTLQRNPTYAAVNIKELHVNEVVGEINQFRPGEILGSLYYLEQGQADAAAKACWADLTGDLSCYKNNLDGLLVPVTFARRAAWWVYKTYADGVGSRVSSTTTNPNIVALASSKSAGRSQAQVLVGYIGYAGGPAPATLRLSLRNLNTLPFKIGNSGVRVRIERVPDAGEATVNSLTLLQDTKYRISNNALDLSLNDLRPHEMLLITLSP